MGQRETLKMNLLGGSVALGDLNVLAPSGSFIWIIQDGGFVGFGSDRFFGSKVVPSYGYTVFSRSLWFFQRFYWHFNYSSQRQSNASFLTDRKNANFNSEVQFSVRPFIPHLPSWVVGRLT